MSGNLVDLVDGNVINLHGVAANRIANRISQTTIVIHSTDMSISAYSLVLVQFNLEFGHVARQSILSKFIDYHFMTPTKMGVCLGAFYIDLTSVQPKSSLVLSLHDIKALLKTWIPKSYVLTAIESNPARLKASIDTFYRTLKLTNRVRS